MRRPSDRLIKLRLIAADSLIVSIIVSLINVSIRSTKWNNCGGQGRIQRNDVEGVPETGNVDVQIGADLNGHVREDASFQRIHDRKGLGRRNIDVKSVNSFDLAIVTTFLIKEKDAE